jgi:hypothetical protein
MGRRGGRRIFLKLMAMGMRGEWERGEFTFWVMESTTPSMAICASGVMVYLWPSESVMVLPEFASTTVPDWEGVNGGVVGAGVGGGVGTKGMSCRIEGMVLTEMSWLDPAVN